MELLAAIHTDLHLYVNFFQSVYKLVEKRLNGAKIHKRYDQAQTPHQRTMAPPEVSVVCKMRLQHQYLQLNPAKLRRQNDDNLRKLWQL